MWFFCNDITKKDMHTTANGVLATHWVLRSPLTFHHSLTLPERRPADSAPCVITHPESITIWASSIFFFFLPFLSLFESDLGWRDCRVNHFCRISELMESQAFGPSSEDLTGLVLVYSFTRFLSCCDSDNPNTAQSAVWTAPKQESTWIIHFL